MCKGPEVGRTENEKVVDNGNGGVSGWQVAETGPESLGKCRGQLEEVLLVTRRTD